MTAPAVPSHGRVRPLSSAEALLRRIVADLHALGRRCALIGGLAVSVRTEPRFTRDADIVVSVTGDADSEALVRSLQQRGWRVVAATEQEAARRLATVRLVLSDDDPGAAVVDLLFASSGIETEIVNAADAIEVIPALAVPVASLAHLIALKVLARDDRTLPQDRVDLAALLRRSDSTVIDAARAALALITERGFHRGRDLAGALAAARQELGP